MVRKYVKTAIERTLVRTGVPRFALRLERRRHLILAYHNIVAGEVESPDPSLHLDRRAFARQLDLLLDTHRVVSLDRMFAADPPAEPVAAITFDDAYRGAVTIGVDELARRGLPATIFVAPKFVPDGVFWWDLLRPREGGGIPERMREDALTRLRGDGDALGAAAGPLGLVETTVGPTSRAATLSELQDALARHPGLSLGSHSWSHKNLAVLEGEELEQELTRPLQWLRERFDRVMPWLAYPYGRTSPAVAAAARRAGYAGALRVEGGRFHRDDADLWNLPRLNIPAGLSSEGFMLRVAGV